MAEYFVRRLEMLDVGAVALDVFGASIALYSSEGGLSYALAIRVLGELGDFMMQEGVEGARFEVQESGGRRIGGGWLVKGYGRTGDT